MVQKSKTQNGVSCIIKKADILLAAFLILVGFAASYVLSFGQTNGDTLLITVGGEKFGSYSLLEDKEIAIDRNSHINKVTIKDGVVSMSFSDCRGQDCVHQHEISRTGESIICLPNQVVLEITGGEAEYDSIAR
ncbi:MAG: NusG domain II-containing protein [Bacillota bacterium]|nr:NusG domain II-containing protein [Bacillota bacterium]